jgi:hypothetical protein
VIVSVYRQDFRSTDHERGCRSTTTTITKVEFDDNGEARRASVTERARVRNIESYYIGVAGEDAPGAST